MPNPRDPLLSLLDRHADRDGAHATALPSLVLLRASCPGPAAHALQEPSLCAVFQGAKEETVGDETYTFGTDRYLLSSVALPIAGRVVEATPACPYLALRLTLDPRVVSDLLAEGVETRPGGPRGLGLGPLDAELRDALGRLVRLLEAPEHLPTLGPLVVREVLYRLLVGPAGGRLRRPAAARTGSDPVFGAVETLRRDYARTLRVEALADGAGLSASAFHRRFKALTGLTPVQFQKRLRLQEARRLLAADGRDVGAVAARVGYDSPSHFSREYRRLFGTPPLRDAARLRGEPRSAR